MKNIIWCLPDNYWKTAWNSLLIIACQLLYECGLRYPTGKIIFGQNQQFCHSAVDAVEAVKTLPSLTLRCVKNILFKNSVFIVLRKFWLPTFFSSTKKVVNQKWSKTIKHSFWNKYSLADTLFKQEALKCFLLIFHHWPCLEVKKWIHFRYDAISNWKDDSFRKIQILEILFWKVF